MKKPPVNIETTWKQYISPNTKITLDDALVELGPTDGMTNLQILKKLTAIAEKHPYFRPANQEKWPTE